MKFPIYMLEISDNEADEAEVDCVSLVSKPAIQRDFLAFNEAARPQHFAIQDEEQRIVSGPAMVPDYPIFRNDDNGQYYTVFSAETISKIAQRFFKKGYQTNLNEEHNGGAVIPNSVFFESWITNKAAGKKPLKGFEDVPDGTWFLTAKINSDETWGKIKSGELRGFSVEGMFNFNPVSIPADPEEALLAQVKEIIDSVKD